MFHNKWKHYYGFYVPADQMTSEQYWTRLDLASVKPQPTCIARTYQDNTLPPCKLSRPNRRSGLVKTRVSSGPKQVTSGRLDNITSHWLSESRNIWDLVWDDRYGFNEAWGRGDACSRTKLEKIQVEVIVNGDRKGFNVVEDGSRGPNLERVRVEVIGNG